MYVLTKVEKLVNLPSAELCPRTRYFLFKLLQKSPIRERGLITKRSMPAWKAYVRSTRSTWSEWTPTRRPSLTKLPNCSNLSTTWPTFPALSTILPTENTFPTAKIGSRSASTCYCASRHRVKGPTRHLDVLCVLMICTRIPSWWSAAVCLTLMLQLVAFVPICDPCTFNRRIIIFIYFSQFILSLPITKSCWLLNLLSWFFFHVQCCIFMTND